MKLALAIVVATTGTAAAFHTPGTFDDTATNGGGNRIYFTGSPRQKGYDCSICHTDAPRTIRAQVAFDPPASGAYQPGATYAVTVTLVGEHAGFGTANNQNGFVAELVDDTAQPAGAYAGDVDLIKLVADGTAVAGMAKNTTAWTFSWTAPAAGRGPLTLHLGMLDGNGAASASIPQTDPGGDDVAVVALRLCEGEPGCADPPAPSQTASKAAGCSAGGGAGWLVAVVLALAIARRRAVVLAVLAGCFDPTLPGECPDHVCGGSNAGVDASTCRENWVCTSWEAPPGGDVATRTCTDMSGAGTTECKPSEGPVTLPALDLELYKCAVHPIFQRGCGQMACHGTDTAQSFRIYTRGRWRNNEIVNRTGTCIPQTGTVNLQTAGSGTVMCEGWLPHTAAEWKKSFDSSRSFMLDVATADDSLLLREAVVGGLPHVNVKLFRDGDPDYATIQSWLAGAQLGTTCNTGRN